MLATLASINAAVLFFIFLYFKRKVFQVLELDEVVAKARQEVGALVAELNLAADRSVSLLEDRTSQASAAVERAEKAILALDRKASGMDRERGIYDRLSRARPLYREGPLAAEPASAPVLGRASAEGDDSRTASAPSGAEAAESLQRTASDRDVAHSARDPAHDAPLPEVRGSEEPVLTGKTPAEKAVELWKQGFSAQIIGHKTGMALSEINLAIAMEEQRLLWNASREP